jgi:hypothetical protein
MPESLEAGNRHQAHSEALAQAKTLGLPADAVATFIEAVQEDNGLTTYLFEANIKAYAGWRWSVTLYQGAPRTTATVSEVVLMPGPDSLLAPAWVPWSERLSDYKALQAELEAQAALDAAEAAELADSEGDEVEAEDNILEIDDFDDLEDAKTNVAESEEVIAVETGSIKLPATDVKVAIEAEADAADASVRPARLFGAKLWIKNKKNRKGK